jgi:hypothetical protein
MFVELINLSSQAQMTSIEARLARADAIEQTKPRTGRKTTRTWLALCTREELDAKDEAPVLAMRMENNEEDYTEYIGLRDAYYDKWLENGMLQGRKTWSQQKDAGKIAMVLCLASSLSFLCFSFANAIKS